MAPKKERDVYQGDLATLNAKKQAWARGDTTSTKYSVAKWIVLGIGFACVLYVATRTYGGSTMMSQLPLHVSIWITALATYLVARTGKRTAELPFSGFHMSRFEVDDDTVYYIFQKGMSIRTYYIKDKEIKKIYRDDAAGIIMIEGSAAIHIQKRNSQSEEKVNEFYAIVPFDKYDLDDLLHPYKRKVVSANGKLRQKYTDEHLLNK